MRSRSRGHRAVGGSSIGLGAAALLAGGARPGLLGGEFLSTPAWALSLTGGSVLVLAGALVLLFSLRGDEEPQPAVPAHVAFNSRMTISDVVPPLPSASPRAAAAFAGSARLPAPAPTTQGRVAPTRPDTTQLDTQIRELTKKINKAGVMLATGQLSQQGYLAYVQDLKRQRASYEAARVRAELKS